MGRYLDSTTAPFRWTWRQATGLARSSWDYFAGFTFDSAIPPSWRETINWLFGTLPRAFGLRETTRREQINANIVLIILSALTSLLSAGATLALIALLWLPLLLFAWFFRGTPAGESYWRRLRAKLPIESDYDIPFWRSE
jgi:hypothetical protein